jgi:hypothetical protein
VAREWALALSLLATSAALPIRRRRRFLEEVARNL